MAEEKTTLADREHPLYKDNISKWEFYRDSAKGGDDFITEDNLFSHRLEDSEDYQERLDRAYYLNFCDSLPDIYNSYIFRENIKRPPDINLEQFRKNCDGKGTHISDFIKKAGRFASIYGSCHILVDIPESTKKNPSLADIKGSKITPFCTIILPTQMPDWSVDSTGNLRWLIYKYIHYNDLDPTIEREEVECYKAITTDKWWIEDADGEQVKFDDGSKSSGVNKLGVIPFYTLYHKDDNNDKVGESMLKDIARINRSIMNWCSLIDEQMERNTFSQLVTPDDASMDEDEQRGRDPLDRIGTSSIFTFNPESKHPPAFISPETHTITTIWNITVDHIKEIFRLAGLQGGTSDLYTSRSGRQSQMSFKGVDSALAEKAMTYQKAENGISKFAYLQLGLKNIDEYEDVKYPTSFDTVALSEEIDSILKILERNFSSTLNKTMMKEISRKSVPLAPESIRKTIEDEIDSGDGVVKSIKSSLDIDHEKLGDGNTATNLEKSFKTNKEVKKEETSHKVEEK
jgi:hypothetical protein